MHGTSVYVLPLKKRIRLNSAVGIALLIVNNLHDLALNPLVADYFRRRRPFTGVAHMGSHAGQCTNTVRPSSNPLSLNGLQIPAQNR